MRQVDGVWVWGDPDQRTLAQAVRCARAGDAAAACLMADAHLGYSMPVGGVVAYRDAVSPDGVGYDIACGILAVRTDLRASEVRPSLPGILDAVVHRVSFGLGRTSRRPVDHELFDDPTWREDRNVGRLKARAAAQLGTVGSGNHFVDLLAEEGTDDLWVAAHFGSRGLGHAIASGFLNLAAGRPFDGGVPKEDPERPPTLIPVASELGQAYLRAMELAGRYAYAGREHVVGQVLEILGARITKRVHNHHNFCWRERHGGEDLWVIRKGATPAFPGQEGFVGGSMADLAAVVAGVDGEEARRALYSTVHGAGRILSRSEAKGKVSRRGQVKRPGRVTRAMMTERIAAFGVLVRGGDVDEAPHVYRPLAGVLAAHAGSVAIRHRLRPIGVVMAGPDVVDPYKD
jgi:tRNA-splicing ligase RtcB